MLKPQWHTLVEDHMNLVYYYAKRYFSNSKVITYDDAISIGNEALIHAAKAYTKRSNGKPFKSYASSSIMNALRRAYRSELTVKRGGNSKRKSFSDLPFIFFDGFNKVDAKDMCSRLLDKAQLDPLSEKIMKLYYWEGYSYKEIAAKLEITSLNVHTALQRVRLKLRAVSSA